MVIKRIEPMSLAKLSLVIYGLIGLLIGGMFSAFGLVAGGLAQMAGGGADNAAPAVFGMLFGVGAIIIAPIFYGLMGFITGLIGAFAFNLAAGWMGGLRIETQ